MLRYDEQGHQYTYLTHAEEKRIIENLWKETDAEIEALIQEKKNG